MNTGNQQAFRALADPSRRAILLHLSSDEMTIGQITEKFDITRAAVKKHLTILEEGDLISVEARGRERINRLKPENLKTVASWFQLFDRYWDAQLNKLEIVVEQHAAKNDTHSRN